MEYKINQKCNIICAFVLMYLVKVTADPVRLNLTGKTTEQSSNWKTDRYFSSAAIDGCYDRDMGRNCCTHTDKNLGPGWWWVDLGQTSIVNSVKVFNRDSQTERLSQFTVYGSNTSDTNSPEKIKCGYRHDRVVDSHKMTCISPMIASNILIKKKWRPYRTLNILTLCEVEIEGCPANTFGQQCNQCGHCQNPQCNWTSETGDCFGGCTAGYTGNSCDSECEGKTYGIGCQSCSENCNDSKCEKFSDSLNCSDGCIAGKRGNDCSVDCEGDTYGIGCKPCSMDCTDAKCIKFSETLNCTYGCIAGRTGENCSLVCNGKTYGIGCQPCSKNCKDTKCEKFSETLICTDGCIAGKTGDDCSLVCPANTYGQQCNQCGHCQNPQCNRTSETGDCFGGCTAGYTGNNCSSVYLTDQSADEIPKGSNSGVIAGALVAVLLILLAVTIVGVIYLRRRKQNQSKPDSSLEIEEAGIDSHSDPLDDKDVKSKNIEKPAIAPKPVSTIDKKNKRQVPKEEASDLVVMSDLGDINLYANADVEGFPKVSPTRILTKDLEHHLLAMESENGSFVNEYEDIPKTTSSISVADRPELKSRNRYKNIVPYDSNSVKLKMQHGDRLTEYINASFIKDYQGKVSYIAALGSTKITLNDTWRMIWEHSIKSIFMVTNLTEDEKIKCEQYWPSNGLLTYGDINVMLERETQGHNIVIRELKVTKDKEEHMVRQYHYISWPDKQPPRSVTTVLKLRGYLKEERLKSTSPILVHCSAGIGRTGTLIAMDILLDQMDVEAAVDIKQCVTDLRHQRTQMVQSLVQYKFLYQCICEIATLGSTVVPVNRLETFMTSAEFVQRTQKEYRFLECVKPVFSKENTEIGRVDYKSKNRDLQVIPSMDHRVKLSLFPEIYINAVYVRGYEGPRAFCATQWPLEGTAGDFWKIILQEKSAAIVCMENDIDNSEWFTEKTIMLTYDEICISGTCALDNKDTKVYDVSIQQQEVNDIQPKEAEYANVEPSKEADVHWLKLIVLKSWATLEISQRDLTLILAIHHIVHTIRNEAAKKNLTVTCRNGARETGLYIAASILFDMINKEQQVDVVQVVKQMRKTRPEFITNQEQYLWLYNVCAAYLSEQM